MERVFNVNMELLLLPLVNRIWKNTRYYEQRPLPLPLPKKILEHWWQSIISCFRFFRFVFLAEMTYLLAKEHHERVPFSKNGWDIRSIYI